MAAHTRLFILASLLAILGFAWQINECSACSCGPATPEMIFDYADLVFRGTVIETDATDYQEQTRVIFAIDTIWKGPVSHTIELGDDFPGSSCRVFFDPGTTYIVYAYDGDGMWVTSRCDRTGPVDAAPEDLDFLATQDPLFTAPEPPAPTEIFHDVWARTDLPVANGVVQRTWMWGTEPLTGILPEPYAESPDDSRQTLYYDKGRLEITQPAADPANPWYVTSGLLATEMITGQVQVGNDSFVTSLPAEIPVAGDLDSQASPTYATMARFLDQPPNPVGGVVVETLERNSGRPIGAPGPLGQDVYIAVIDEVMNHSIAEPFWEFMNATGPVYQDDQFITSQLFEHPYLATGRPITEPYWSYTSVGGTSRSVLIQCFERRCLTYTPDNPDGWKVEAGNVGLHYYTWRYAARPQIERDILFLKQIDFDPGHINAIDVFVTNAAGGDVRNLTERVIGNAIAARWSPDGSQVLIIVSRPDIGHVELWVANPDTNDLWLVAGGLSHGTDAASWSPDSSQIAFIIESGEIDGLGDLFVANADGSNLRQMTAQKADQVPAWSPDGSQIAFERITETEEQLIVIALSGNSERKIITIPRLCGDPGCLEFAWAPDGQRFAVIGPPSDRSGGFPTDVTIVGLDGTNPVVVASWHGFGGLRWSPDGQKLAFDERQFGSGDLNGSAVWLVNLPNDNIFVLGNDYTNPRNPAWSPDGSLVAMSNQIRSTELPPSYQEVWHSGIGRDTDWSPDGRFVTSWTDAGVSVVAVDGSSQWLLSDFAWSPRWRPTGSTRTTPVETPRSQYPVG